MPLVVRKFSGIGDLNKFLAGTLLGGPVQGSIRPGLFLHGLTLIFTQPVSATVTFASTPAGSQIPISMQTVIAQIEAQATGVDASFQGNHLCLSAIGGGQVSVTAAGTANPILGFSTSSASTSSAAINPEGQGSPELLDLSSTDGISYIATINEGVGGASAGTNKFHLGARSGVVAASLGANAVLFAWRNPHASIIQNIRRIVVKWRTILGYTAAQELALELLPVTDFDDADYTGGTDLSHPTTPANKAYIELTGGSSILESGNVTIATTAGMTPAGGTPVIASHPWMWDAFKELAADPALHTGYVEMFWEATDVIPKYPLGFNEGFVIRNPIALGAGGTGRLSVEVDWDES